MTEANSQMLCQDPVHVFGSVGPSAPKKKSFLFTRQHILRDFQFLEAKAQSLDLMKCKNANAFPKKVNGCVEPTVWGSCLHYICDLSIWQRPDQGAIDSSPWLINFLSILAYGSARKSRIFTVLFVLQYFPGYRHASSNFIGLRRNRKRTRRREVACWLKWFLVSAPCLCFCDLYQKWLADTGVLNEIEGQFAFCMNSVISCHEERSHGKLVLIPSPWSSVRSREVSLNAKVIQYWRLRNRLGLAQHGKTRVTWHSSRVTQ